MKTITYDENEWKLVPVEPTHEMVLVGVNAGVNASHLGEKWFPAAYRAALAAAPQPPTARDISELRAKMAPEVLAESERLAEEMLDDLAPCDVCGGTGVVPC